MKSSFLFAKLQICVLEPLYGHTGVYIVCALLKAGWKALRLSVNDNCIVIAIALTYCERKSVKVSIFEDGGSLWARHSAETTVR